MKLILDIGNSRVKGGIFQGDKLLEVMYPTVLDIDFLEGIEKKYPSIKRTLLSAVGDYSEEVKLKLETNYQLVVMNAGLKFPIKNLYKTPLSLGSDRLAGVIGANCLFPKQNNIVIDAGTCVTVDFIDSSSTYHGGAILPGMGIKFNALHTFTKNLPLLENKNNTPPAVIGGSTSESIYSGVLNGALFEVEGFINAILNRYGSSNIIFTGGDHLFFVENLKIEKFAEPNLVLTGLNVILDINATK